MGIRFFSALLMAAFVIVCGHAPASAIEAADPGLSLEVSPSPIVLTLKPGETKTVDVKIFNAGSSVENLMIALQNFTINKKNSAVNLDNELPPEVKGWIKFGSPKFSVKPGERVSQIITISVPESAGFSYNFAVVISRQTPPKASPGQSSVIGSVAIFTLLNIDRPGAVRKLAIDSFVSQKRFYEYLPAELTLKLTNEGNSLLLPAGNAYIQRTADSSEPTAVLPVNPASLYLLPGVTRDYVINWSDGLPAYVTKASAANAEPQRQLEWNWRGSQFRIGRYIAKVVVVFNDGQRDIPIESQVSFWVIPWKIIGGGLIGILLLLTGMFAIGRFVVKTLKRNKFKYRA